MENILELQQVSKTFSKSKFSLENVSFNLPYGAIMGFVGENVPRYILKVCILEHFLQQTP